MIKTTFRCTLVAIYAFQLYQERTKAHYNTNFGCTLVAIYTFFPALLWKEKGTLYTTQIPFIFQLYRRKGEKKSSSLEFISNSNEKDVFCCCNSVRFKEFATFLPTILSTFFRWLVTVRNFPTLCKIQGNCNPFFFTHIPNPKIQGICNFLAHNSQLVQARAHALREPIPS